MAFFLNLARVIFAYRNNVKLTRLYENRDDLPSRISDYEGAEEVWVLWRIGTTAKTLPQEIWGNTHFTRLLMHHPKPNSGPYYLKAHVMGFPNLTLNTLCQDIYTATSQAPKHIDVRWFNGYLGDSVLIVNPNSTKKDGWIRIEVTTACSQGDDRPSILVKEKQYPKLFRTLVKNYEAVFEKGESPPTQYRQSPNLSNFS